MARAPGEIPSPRRFPLDSATCSFHGYVSLYENAAPVPGAAFADDYIE